MRLQISLECFEQVAGHGYIATLCLHSVDHVAPTGNEPFALDNLSVGFLQTL
ncbi:MAG: hypothetical protein ACJ8FP_03850 [Xanthobacteraceae bacterium]